MKHSSLRTAFPVASVWFGALVGPSMISGAFAALYFVPYGAVGLLLSFLSMGLASVIVAFGSEVTRRERVYSYAELSRRIYRSWSPLLSPLLEVYMVLAMIIGGSSVVSMAGTFYSGLTGQREIIGAVLISALSIVLVLWGARIVRASSLLITILMIAGMVALLLSAVSFRWEETVAAVTHFDSLGRDVLIAGITGALTLALSNSVNALTLSSVEQNVEKKSDSIMIGVLSFLLNSFAFVMSTLMILPYREEVVNDSVPVLRIVNSFLSNEMPWLPLVYMVTMFFALLSSGAPQLNAVAYRIDKIYPDAWLFKSQLFRNLTTGVLYFALCILISKVGLRTIIGKGYSALGFLSLPLIVIPLVIIMPLRYSKKENEKVIYNENKQIV